LRYQLTETTSIFQFEVENSFLSFDAFSNLLIVTLKNNSNFFVQETSFSLLIGHKECYEVKFTEIIDVKSIYLLDFNETMRVGTRISRKISSDKPDVAVYLSNPEVFDLKVINNILSSPSNTVGIQLQTNSFKTGMSAMNIDLFPTDDCPSSLSFTLLVITQCVFKNKLVFDYTSFIPREKLFNQKEFVHNESYFTQNLPPNYRAPSNIGKSIPRSNNIYNYQSEPENFTGLFSKFHVPYELGEQCTKDDQTSPCSCSEAQRFSSLQIYSECKQKVYKAIFGREYSLKAAVVCDVATEGLEHNSTGILQVTDFFVYLEEVNKRANFVVEDDSSEICENNPNSLLCRSNVEFQKTEQQKKEAEEIRSHVTYGHNSKIYNLNSLRIVLHGEGLFHFRISLIRGYSYCHLYDEFQVYVVNNPLQYPISITIRCLIVLSIGMLLLYLFLNRKQIDI